MARKQIKRRLLKKGDRIRLTKTLIGGWKGEGVVIRDQVRPDDIVAFRRDGYDEFDRCLACSEQVVKKRK